MASSSWHTPAMTPALASSRGSDALCLATFNIGARSATAYTGPAEPAFKEKLARDMNIVAKDAAIICLQEANSKWADEAWAAWPGYWGMESFDSLAILYNQNRVKSTGPVKQYQVFPQADAAIARRFRYYLEVAGSYICYICLL